jgi:Tol biopolymer transport system component
MSTASDFDRTLETWLADVRPTSPPAGLLDHALDRVADTPRRRAWLISDRWVWGATARRAAAGGRFLLAAGALLLLVMAIVAAVILVGSARPAPPFGLTRAGFITEDAAEGIIVARIDGSERHVLVPRDGEAVSPIWSRDGLHLAFWGRAAPGKPWELTVVDEDGGGRRVIASGVTLREREEAFSQPSAISWSPDSERMTYAADTPGGTSIFVADLAGHVTRITDPAFRGIDPAWSPDGRTIVFVSGLSTTLHTVSPDGTHERELASLRDIVLWPDWSPDGALIAVCAPAGSDQQLDIFTVSADGSTVTNVSHDPSGEFSPTWSPDGTRLAWARAPADESARAYVVVGSRDGTRVVELRTPADLAPPVWSPDGTRLFSYVMDDKGSFYQVLVLDPEGTAPPVRIPVDGSVGNGSWQRLP